VALIDALLDAGAEIEHEGLSIDGGPPLSSAVGYGQWAAARRLVERGARTLLWHKAALGLIEAGVRKVAPSHPPRRMTRLCGHIGHGAAILSGPVARSAYPPILFVCANMRARRPSAKSRLRASQQRTCSLQTASQL
jgi:hypothetical protein